MFQAKCRRINQGDKRPVETIGKKIMAMQRGRIALAGAILSMALCAQCSGQEPQERGVKHVTFEPTWESFEENYRCPEWFRDAKFGIWAHWSPQCVPEDGDWYARHMYIQGTEQYTHHLQHYGHPSKSGFMEIDNAWKAEKWDPEKLMTLYKKAGAKYFVALANHHDNFDAYNSKYHEWNSVNVGPKKDIVGIWEKVARRQGLYFGVSNHSAHAWHWLQTAYGYDGEGDYAGIRYDAATLKKEDGKGKWWEGLDPQHLYAGATIVMPDGLTSAKEVVEWHEMHTRPWNEDAPPTNPEFVSRWFLRCKDVVDSYKPDFVYFDDFGLPLGQTGLDMVAHIYNSNADVHNGNVGVVVTAKYLKGDQNKGVVEDFERGFVDSTKALPWQTCTCIGDWHYKRALYTEKKYKTVPQVVHQLIDIVSKNGNLLLSIPVRGDGSIDELEMEFLEGLSAWMDVNGEGIFGTRPWKVFGEGPTQISTGMFNENQVKFTPQDFRFTTKGNALYMFMMGWPGGKQVVVKSLASDSPLLAGKKIAGVEMLGQKERLTWQQTPEGLTIALPGEAATSYAVTFRIHGVTE
jgi:alpha-L-fucosidase